MIDRVRTNRIVKALITSATLRARAESMFKYVDNEKLSVRVRRTCEETANKCLDAAIETEKAFRCESGKTKK